MKNDSLAWLSHFDYFPNSFIMTFGTISLGFASVIHAESYFIKTSFCILSGLS